MKKKKHIIYYILLIVIVAFQLITNKEDQNLENHDAGDLTVDFIDVGQGDAILITTSEGKTMLIDAGDNQYEDYIVDLLKQKGLKEINYLIGTHPHADHIGGLDAVIRNFDIGEIYMPRVSHTTKTFKDVLLAVKEKGYTIKTAKAGVTLGLDHRMNIEILGPVNEDYENLNNHSAIIRLKYGSTSFLFTGDAEKLSEYEMIDAGYPLYATVLKVGHHGSVTSTADEFLEAVDPTYAVISSEKDNSYGHPHKEIIQKLEDRNITYYDTQDHGTITATTDGQTIKWSMEY